MIGVERYGLTASQPRDLVLECDPVDSPEAPELERSRESALTSHLPGERFADPEQLGRGGQR